MKHLQRKVSPKLKVATKQCFRTLDEESFLSAMQKSQSLYDLWCDFERWAITYEDWLEFKKERK